MSVREIWGIGDEMMVSQGEVTGNGDEFSDDAHRLTWVEGILVPASRQLKCISGWKAGLYLLESAPDYYGLEVAEC